MHKNAASAQKSFDIKKGNWQRALKSNMTAKAAKKILHNRDERENFINLKDTDGANILITALLAQPKNEQLLIPIIAHLPARIVCEIYKGTTALHLAAEKSTAIVCERLVQKGISVNSKDRHGYTPIYTVAKNELDVAKSLIAKGATVKPFLPFLLTQAVDLNNEQLLDFLLSKYKIDINFKDESSDQTLIQKAVQNGCIATIKTLLNYGAISNILDEIGNDLLHLAILHNHIDIAEFLLISQKFDINQVNQDGNSSLHLATLNNSLKAACFLLIYGADLSIVNKTGKLVSDIQTSTKIKQIIDISLYADMVSQERFTSSHNQTFSPGLWKLFIERFKIDLYQNGLPSYNYKAKTLESFGLRLTPNQSKQLTEIISTIEDHDHQLCELLCQLWLNINSLEFLSIGNLLGILQIGKTERMQQPHSKEVFDKTFLCYKQIISELENITFPLGELEYADLARQLEFNLLKDLITLFSHMSPKDLFTIAQNNPDSSFSERLHKHLTTSYYKHSKDIYIIKLKTELDLSNFFHLPEDDSLFVEEFKTLGDIETD